MNIDKKLLHFVLDFDIMIVNLRGFQNMNPELAKSKVALMNVFNGRTNGNVKELFSKFLEFYVARINKYVGVVSDE